MSGQPHARSMKPDLTVLGLLVGYDWQSREAKPSPVVRTSSITECVLAVFSTLTMVALLGWPIYGLIAG